jgi:hypothetical protein
MPDAPTLPHPLDPLADPEPDSAPEGSPYDRPAGYWPLSGVQRVAPNEDDLLDTSAGAGTAAKPERVV